MRAHAAPPQVLLPPVGHGRGRGGAARRVPPGGGPGTFGAGARAAGRPTLDDQLIHTCQVLLGDDIPQHADVLWGTAQVALRTRSHQRVCQ